jgi:hypothetical protein
VLFADFTGGDCEGGKDEFFKPGDCLGRARV